MKNESEHSSKETKTGREDEERMRTWVGRSPRFIYYRQPEGPCRMCDILCET